MGMARAAAPAMEVADAMLEAMVDLDDLRPSSLRPLKRVEYDRLVDLGMFDDEKIELLRGQLVTMSPQGLPHTRLYVWLTRFLIERLDRTFEVRPASPFAATDDSEPEPDLMVTRPDPAASSHPTAAILVIEISSSSIRKDRRIKMPIYAESGAPEYWILDVSREGQLVVEVYTEPTPTGYAKLVCLRDGDILRPLHLPFEIAVADLPR